MHVFVVARAAQRESVWGKPQTGLQQPLGALPDDKLAPGSSWNVVGLPTLIQVRCPSCVMDRCC